MSEEKRILKKIRALLAKADAKRNDNANEREIAMRQATKLMDMYSIGATELNEEEEEDQRGVGHAETGSAKWKSNVVNQMSILYGCKAYRTPGKDGKTFVIGRESYRTTALQLAHYVIKSIERESKRYTGTGRSYIMSFKLGAASGVAQQVREIKRDRQQGETTSSSTALVVVDFYRTELSLNENYIKDQLGINLRKGQRTNFSNEYAYQSGITFGRTISLNNQIGGGSNSHVKRLT